MKVEDTQPWYSDRSRVQDSAVANADDEVRVSGLQRSQANLGVGLFERTNRRFKVSGQADKGEQLASLLGAIENGEDQLVGQRLLKKSQSTQCAGFVGASDVTGITHRQVVMLRQRRQQQIKRIVAIEIEIDEKGDTHGNFRASASGDEGIIPARLSALDTMECHMSDVRLAIL